MLDYVVVPRNLDNTSLDHRQMPYAKRASDGTIEALLSVPDQNGTEWLDPCDIEVKRFLSNHQDDNPHEALAISDAQLLRVLEDLIDLLVRKQIIMYTDLPEQAQAKLFQRQRLREQIPAAALMVDQDDIL